MTNKLYARTDVSVGRSQEAIRLLLTRFGARHAQFNEDYDEGVINIRFGTLVGNTPRTVSVTAHVPKDAEVRGGRNYRLLRGKAAQEQLARMTYRALHDWLKSQFAAVEFKLASFESIFLSYIEWQLPGGGTATTGEILIPRLPDTLSLPAGLAPEEDGNTVLGEYKEVEE